MRKRLGIVRYLLGDSAEFREQYNFLATLRGFVACAGRVSKLQHEIQTLKSDMNEHLSSLSNVSDQVAEFCDTLIVLITSKAKEKAHPEPIGSIAKQQVQNLSSALAAARANMSQEAQRTKANISQQIDTRRHEIVTTIGTFLTTESLPVLSSSFSMQVGGQGVVLSANFEFRGGITASFDLDPGRAGELSTPQRIQSFATDLTLQIGEKKKFLSKDLSPVTALLDPYYLTALELAEGMCSMKLRRKLELSSDSLVIEMRRKGGRFAARITNLEGEAQQTIDAEPADHERLKNLWNALSERVTPALANKQKLKKLRLDGNDVFKNDLVLDFIDRLIDQFAPIVADISEHSPNADELSLKIDRSDGRREEIYVRKSDLAKNVLSLPDDYLERFALLDIFPETEEILTEADLLEQPVTAVRGSSHPPIHVADPRAGMDHTTPDADLVALADELIASGDDIIDE